MDTRINLTAAVEAILFMMGEAIEIGKIAEATGSELQEVDEALSELEDRYNLEDSGLELKRFEDKVQICTKSVFYDVVKQLLSKNTERQLSDTALETLSIIAYKQPVTRAEIEHIRGVACDRAVNKLVEAGLVCELGRMNAPGRPLLFGTTEEFLRAFGVSSLEELPIISGEKNADFEAEAEREVEIELKI